MGVLYAWRKSSCRRLFRPASTHPRRQRRICSNRPSAGKRGQIRRSATRSLRPLYRTHIHPGRAFALVAGGAGQVGLCNSGPATQRTCLRAAAPGGGGSCPPRKERPLGPLLLQSAEGERYSFNHKFGREFSDRRRHNRICLGRRWPHVPAFHAGKQVRPYGNDRPDGKDIVCRQARSRTLGEADTSPPRLDRQEKGTVDPGGFARANRAYIARLTRLRLRDAHRKLVLKADGQRLVAQSASGKKGCGLVAALATVFHLAPPPITKNAS